MCDYYDVVICYLLFFFFKQKTAYEMRISDWSSDVCSSDLLQPLTHAPEHAGGDLRQQGAGEDVVDVAGAGVDLGAARGHRVDQRVVVVEAGAVVGAAAPGDLAQLQAHDLAHVVVDRKSVGEGKRVSGRVDLGGIRTLKKKNQQKTT